MTTTFLESIDWEVVGRTIGHAVLALMITPPLVAWLAWPMFWEGDIAVVPFFVDRLSAELAAMLSLCGAPPSVLVHLTRVGVAWQAAIDPVDGYAAALAPWLSAGVAGFVAVLTEKRDLFLSVAELEERRSIHLRGPRLIVGDAAIAAGRFAEGEAVGQSGQGIYVAPGLPISLRRETRQIMVVGSIGGGKSELLKFLMTQMIGRGDKMLVHDSKGEFCSEWPDEKFGILSPVDRRSAAWCISSDCIGVASARELAAKLLPQGKTTESTWTDGAREILYGLILHLQQNVVGWHWGHLNDMLALSPPDMRSIILSIYPQAEKYLEADGDGVLTKTAQSFLVTLDSAVASVVGQLAAAWGHNFAGQRISLTRWIADDKTGPQALLLVSAADYSQLSRVWTGAAVALMSRIVASPRMENSSTRRLWLILDECKQLGRLEDFQSLMEVGRSRGIRVVTAWQDLKQIEQVYSEKADFDVFTSLPKTKVVLQSSPGASSQHVSESWIGQRLVRLSDKTIRHGAVDSMGAHETWIPVITGHEIDSTLGVVRSDDGDLVSRGLVIGIGPDVLRLEWPPAGWATTRPARVPATWTGDVSVATSEASDPS